MKEITNDLNHDLTFNYTHSTRSMFRALGIYNFGRTLKNERWIEIQKLCQRMKGQIFVEMHQAADSNLKKFKKTLHLNIVTLPILSGL